MIPPKIQAAKYTEGVMAKLALVAAERNIPMPITNPTTIMVKLNKFNCCFAAIVKKCGLNIRHLSETLLIPYEYSAIRGELGSH